MRPHFARPTSTTLAAAVAALLPLAACQNAAEPTALRAAPPRFEIVDAVHGNGNSKFVWLPPTVSTNPAYSGMFASGLQPTVTVCYGTAASCPSNTVAHFTRTGGTGGASIAENTTSPSYRVTWISSSCDARTDPMTMPAYCPLVPGQVYRMTVTIPATGGGEIELGHADIKIYRSLTEQFKELTPGAYIPLLQNRPIGIAFRIAN